MLLLLQGALVLSAVAASGGLLGLLARDARVPGAVLAALLLGPGETGRRGPDLRFATFVAALGLQILVVLTFLSTFRALGAAELAFGLTLSLPVTAAGLAGLADLAARVLPDGWSFPLPGLVGRRRADGSLEGLLDEARSEVANARGLVRDPALLAALDALDEAVNEYGRALDDVDAPDEADLAELRVRIEGVMALTRSCLEKGREEAGRVLGVRPDADPAEVEAVYRALARIYSGEAGLTGVDPSKLEEIETAYRQLAQPATALAAAA